MPKQSRSSIFVALAWLSVTGLCGCGVLPWNAPQKTVATYPPAASPHLSQGGTVVQAGGPLPEDPFNHVALLKERLAEAEDVRKVLLARIDALEKQLAGRDQILSQSSKEIDKARSSLTEHYDEIKVFRKDVLELRNRMEGLETENVQTLKLIIKTLERLVEAEDPKSVSKRNRSDKFREALRVLSDE